MVSTAEDLAFLSIGKIVARFARLDNWARLQVTDFQMIGRARFSRLPGTLYPGEAVPLEEIHEAGSFHPRAKDYVKLRFGYCQKLARALLGDGPEYSQFAKLIEEALSLYEIRCVVAHSGFDIDAEGQVVFSSQGAAEKALKRRLDDIDKSIETRKLIPIRSIFDQSEEELAASWDEMTGQKGFRQDELDAAAERLDTIWWDLRAAADAVPIEGPRLPPVSPPKR